MLSSTYLGSPPSKIDHYQEIQTLIKKQSSLVIRVGIVALPLIIFLGAIGTPFGCYLLHACTLKEAVICAALGGAVVLCLKWLHNQSGKKEKELLYEKLYKPLFKEIVSGAKEIGSVALEEFLMCLESADETILSEVASALNIRRSSDLLTHKEVPANFDPSFEAQAASEKERSSLSHLGFKEPPNGRIGFVNGILTSYDSAFGHALLLSRLSGGYNVHIVHNASHGVINDLDECRKGLAGIPTDPVLFLHQQWDEFFDQGGEGDFLQICHSQGAIHTRNALLHYSPEKRKRIKVVAIAPAAYISDKICKEAIHYTSWDPIPHVDTKGKESVESKQVRYCETSGYENHGFRSLIYFKPLTEELQNFISG